MNTLTENELKMYLGTGLKVKNRYSGLFEELVGIGSENMVECSYNGVVIPLPISAIQPILYPLSMLTKEELINQGFNSHIDYLTHEKQDPLKAPYNMVQYLFSKHYDVQNLIQQGKAIAVTNEFNPYK